jgi:hypothetical protein
MKICFALCLVCYAAMFYCAYAVASFAPLCLLRAVMRDSCLCFVWTLATRTWDRPGQGKRDYSTREARFARAHLRYNL